MRANGAGARPASNPSAEDVRLAAEFAERVATITAPYIERDGPHGFPAIVATEAADILATQYTREDLATSVAAYRRRLADQEALTSVAMDALVAAEAFRRGADQHLLSETIQAGMAVVRGTGGRPPRELIRAIAALKRLFPTGTPPEDEVSHADLARDVEADCKARKLKPPSTKTVIRARRELSSQPE